MPDTSGMAFTGISSKSSEVTESIDRTDGFRSHIRSFFSDKTFMWMTTLFSVHVVLGIAQALVFLSLVLVGSSEHFEQNTLLIIGGSASVLLLLGVPPFVLIALGLWTVYHSSHDENGVLLRGFERIRLGLVWGVLLQILVLISVLVSTAVLWFTILSEFFQTTIGPETGVLIGSFLIIAFVLLAGFAVGIVYRVLLIQLINKVMKAYAQGSSSGRLSLIITIASFAIALLSVSQLFSNASSISSLLFNSTFHNVVALLFPQSYILLMGLFVLMIIVSLLGALVNSAFHLLFATSLIKFNKDNALTGETTGVLEILHPWNSPNEDIERSSDSE